MGGQPDITDEDIGMRAFQVRKGKAAERALERMRHGLGSDWAQLRDADLEELEWVLGELWAYVSRSEWEDLHFGNLKLVQVWRLLALGRELRRRSRPAVDVLGESRELVASA